MVNSLCIVCSQFIINQAILIKSIGLNVNYHIIFYMWYTVHVMRSLKVRDLRFDQVCGLKRRNI